MTRDYKSTVFLPQTDFPMRGGLPQKEPELLARWDRMGLFGRLREASKDRPLWALHDGPQRTCRVLSGAPQRVDSLTFAEEGDGGRAHHAASSFHL